MRNVSNIEPEPGTELFSSTEVLAPGAGDKWQIGFGPINGSGAAWVLYRRDRDGERKARKVLLRTFPARLSLYAWLAMTTGPRQAAAMLRTIGPLDEFYRRYAAGRPELTPPRPRRSLSLTLPRRSPRPAVDMISEAKTLQRSRWARSTTS
jgi:hypothetical protein